MPRILRSALLALLCAVSGAAVAAPSASSPTPPAWLARAASGLAANGKSAVGLLVLGRDDNAAYDAALLHSASAAYALRRVDLVILRRDGDRYVSERIPHQCNGQDACAADAFLGGVSADQVSALLGRDTGGTTFLAFDAHARRIGVAHGGFDSLKALVRFASGLNGATAAKPDVDYADGILAETP